jgi:hypothetical protein
MKFRLTWRLGVVWLLAVLFASLLAYGVAHYVADTFPPLSADGDEPPPKPRNFSNMPRGPAVKDHISPFKNSSERKTTPMRIGDEVR